jgi:TP901 family phage tail tape measure protein
VTDTAVIFDIIGRDRTSAAVSASGSAFNKFAIGLAAGAAFAGAKFVDMAANFQQGMTRLKTGAGEVDSNMSTVSKGILKLAGEVGESTKDLLKGMYLIESAGFHGADGLNVLKVAAQGAKVGNADMATVADAVTTALNAYHQGASGAAAATNALIAAEGQGKTNLEALSGSLSTVAPIASLAHVSLNELLAAMATMTGQGTDAASAATYLKQTIGQLSNPTAKAKMEMQALGLDSVKVSMNLGKNGLASTLQMLTDAIQTKMGPAGTVLIQKLQKAASSTTDFQKVLANLPPTQQTFIGALATMTGGTKSMQAALELTGDNMKVFQHNTDVINEKVKAGGSTIEGWADVQKNFNQRLSEAKGTVEAFGIQIGNGLLPKATALLGAIMSLVEWFTKHKNAASAMAIVMGTLAGLFIAIRMGMVIAETATKGWMVATKLATAAQWLWNSALFSFPGTWIILAILAVAAGVYLLWTHSAGFRTFFIGAWNDIWRLMKTIGAWFAGPFVNFFVNAGKMIAAPYLWLWHTVLDPMWQAWSAGFHIVMQIMTSFINLWRDVVNFFFQMWLTTMKPVFKMFADAANWLYNTILVPWGHNFMIFIRGVGDVMTWLWHYGVELPLQGMAKALNWVYNAVIKPVFGFVKQEVVALGNIFQKIFSAIGSWIGAGFSQGVGLMKGALNGMFHLINSAINFINHDVVDNANKFPGVNFPHIANIPYLAKGGEIGRGGLAVVADNGPELITLPTGATVQPLSGGSAGSSSDSGSAQGRTVYFGPGIDTAFATYFRQLINTGKIVIR